MPKFTNSRLALLLVAALAAAFVVVPASASLAQSDPSQAQYNPPIPETGTGSGTGSDPSSGLDTPLGSLPFTGQDLLILLAVAGLLVGTGYGLRKLSTPRGPEA